MTDANAVAVSIYPKSISISQMLKLGLEIPMKVNNLDVVDIIGFDISKMEWGQPKGAHIFIEDEPFSKGGFRVVSKGKSFDKTYVVKRFLPQINKEIEK